MWTFIKLFLICSVAGVLAASFMWVFFWMIGIFEIPVVVRKFLHIALKGQYQEAALSTTALLTIGLDRQAGIAATPLVFVLFKDTRTGTTSTLPQFEGMNTALSERNVESPYVSTGN
jgi:hypothetical protein